MIVVEGPDGAGKTTLAKAISETLGIPYMRPPAELLSSTDGPSEELVEWWDEQLKDNTTPRVYDRTMFVSDAIYAVVGDRFPLAGWETMEQGMNHIQSAWITIFAIPDFDVVGANIDADIVGGKHLAGLETAQRIWNHYYMYRLFHYLWRQAVPHRTNWYDYTKHDTAAMIEWVRRTVENPGWSLSTNA